MMSKERELLKRLVSVDLSDIYDLLIEAQELLAQPEQEPVAWMQDDIELYVQESKDTIRGYVIPLYTAPPKHTSLELEVADCCGSEDYREGFKDGALYAEKAHGITGGGE
jgi:hypothetical protein